MPVKEFCRLARTARHRPRQCRYRHDRDADAECYPGLPLARLKREQESRHDEQRHKAVKMDQRQGAREQTDQERRRDEHLQRPAVCTLIFLSIPCTLCGKDTPQIAERQQGQRHSEQQASLRHKEHDERIAPAEIVVDGVILWQVPEKIGKTLSAFGHVFERPDKAKSAAEEKQEWCDAASQLAARDADDKALEYHE